MASDAPQTVDQQIYLELRKVNANLAVIAENLERLTTLGVVAENLKQISASASKLSSK